MAVTHANPKFLSDIRRNKSDKVLRALAANGGMLGFSLYPHLIGGREVTLDRFCIALAQAADMLGPEKIGIGTDLVTKQTPAYLNWLRMGRWTHTVDYGAGSAANPGWPEWQDWFQGPADFETLRSGLISVGFLTTEVDGILGENWLRFFEEAIG